MGSFELLEHTAEVGLRIEGETLEEVFAQAALGLLTIMTEPESVQERLSRTVEATAPDREALLVAWLNELIYLFETQGLLFRRCRIQHLEDTALSAECTGEPFDPARHTIRCGVKAATYHLLEVRGNGRWRARVLLDI